VEGAVLVLDRQLAAGDRPHAECLGRVRELERSAEVVVIGQRERVVALLVGLRDQLLRARRAVEEGVGRVAVELRVGERQGNLSCPVKASGSDTLGEHTFDCKAARVRENGRMTTVLAICAAAHPGGCRQ
jgi:hypothetical protein